jgi:hypothetical protein
MRSNLYAYHAWHRTLSCVMLVLWRLLRLGWLPEHFLTWFATQRTLAAEVTYRDGRS